jgi:hypothetical protein
MTTHSEVTHRLNVGRYHIISDGASDPLARRPIAVPAKRFSATKFSRKPSGASLAHDRLSRDQDKQVLDEPPVVVTGLVLGTLERI